MSKCLRIAATIGFLSCSLFATSTALAQGEGTTASAACSIEGPDNCQPFDDSFNFVPSNRGAFYVRMLAAEDFVPLESTLTSLCVWGFYIDTDFAVPNSQDDCGPSVFADYFRVRVYTNDPGNGRMPGTLVGESTTTSQREVLPTSVVESNLQNEMYEYQMTLNTPITDLTPGQVYWLEVSNDPTISGPPLCVWFWSQRQQTSSTYSFTSDDDVYRPGFESPFDNAFCTNFPIQPSVLGTQPGACCTCGNACSEKTLSECDYISGFWDITRTTCAGVTCPAIPTNNNCVDGPTIITGRLSTFDNQCATTDGYGPIATDYGSSQIEGDLWYYYTAPVNCDLTIDTCFTPWGFDTILAVYHEPDNPTVCPPCALLADPNGSQISSATLAGIGQDESCTPAVGGGGRWNSLYEIGRPALPGECFLIRVGGFDGYRGTGVLSVNCRGVARPAPGPIGLHSRFISFWVPGGAVPPETALRVSWWPNGLHNPPGGYTSGSNLAIPYTFFDGTPLWVGPPAQYTESAADPTTFMASTLQCTPYYQDWSTISLLHVTGEMILPSSAYDVENLGASCMSNEGNCTVVSEPLWLTTARFGDVIINGVANFPDIQAEVAKYQSKSGAPIKARSKIGTSNQRGLINIAAAVGFIDISADVAAYQGRPYPYKPGKCSGAPTTACKDDAECAANGPCILCP